MLTAWLMMLAADVHLAYAAAVPAWLMRQAYHVFYFWLGVGSGFCLAALALVISLGFRKKNDFGSCLFH